MIPPTERAELPPRPESPEPPTFHPPAEQPRVVGALRLIRYRSLFSGPVVERVEELQFQRPEPVIELSEYDARIRHVANGDTVEVRSNGTSIELRARINRRLMEGAVRAPVEHTRELESAVEVRKPL
jgi:predicted molibdopterin-dependent oxidoreductase YjgC